jgi:MFS superfamily sulfate permease-like transporter
MLTLLIGLISLALIIGLRYVAPRIPGALVLVIAGIIASNVLNLGDPGGGSFIMDNHPVRVHEVYLQASACPANSSSLYN